MDHAKLAELRSRVAETPEGSLARELLALIDEDLAAERARDRRKLVDVVRLQGRTPEEAEALVAAYEQGGIETVETETVRCWTCEGWGFVLGPGGDRECSTCHGSQTASRFKMPTPKEPA